MILRMLFVHYIKNDALDRLAKLCGEEVSPDCVLKLSENLASKTTFKIGGAAEYYVEPTSVSDVLTIIQCSRLFSYYCIGRGSNILVSDSGYAGIVIRFNHKNCKN